MVDNHGMPANETTPREAQRRHAAGARLVDVREEHERSAGMADGAVGISRAELEDDPGFHFPDRDTELVLICQTGGRSMLAAESLQRLGYRHVASVRGGTLRWIAEGLPVTRPPAHEVDSDFHERYSRHLLLPEVGARGQRRLEASRVLMLGAGGLGSPAAFYLAAAGIGHLRIADDDIIERSNLQRQILHTDADIGMPKVDSAETRLSALNPRITVEAVRERVTSGNVERLLEGVDLVVDGADNFAVRYLLNDACVSSQSPWCTASAQLRRPGQRVRRRPPPGRGAMLPLPVPGASAGRGRAQLQRGRRARRAARRDRHAAGHRGTQAAAARWRAPRSPAALERWAHPRNPLRPPDARYARRHEFPATSLRRLLRRLRSCA